MHERSEEKEHQYPNLVPNMRGRKSGSNCGSRKLRSRGTKYSSVEMGSSRDAMKRDLQTYDTGVGMKGANRDRWIDPAIAAAISTGVVESHYG